MAPPRTGSSLISHRPTEGQGSMKRITCSLLVATLPFDSVLVPSLAIEHAFKSRIFLE
jgi:hypothetical protein